MLRLYSLDREWRNRGLEEEMFATTILCNTLLTVNYIRNKKRKRKKNERSTSYEPSSKCNQSDSDDNETSDRDS